MIVGLGLDMVDVARIRDLHRRRGDRFLRRVYTDAEVAECLKRHDPGPSLAARFAAKEAGMKALGTGWSQGVTWQDFEVVPVPGGAPRISLHGVAAARAGRLQVVSTHLTLTHDAHLAAAVVVLEARGEPGP